MVDWHDFKKALGKTAERHTDEEIQRLNEKAAKLAQMLFDIWYATLKKASPQREDDRTNADP